MTREEMTNEDKIKEGLIALLEKRLSILEKAISENEIYSKVRLCMDIEKIAEQEGIDTKEYVGRKTELIKEFYNKKK